MTTPRIEIAFAPAGWREALDRYLVQHAHGMNGYMLSRGRIESLIRFMRSTMRNLPAWD